MSTLSKRGSTPFDPQDVVTFHSGTVTLMESWYHEVEMDCSPGSHLKHAAEKGKVRK